MKRSFRRLALALLALAAPFAALAQTPAVGIGGPAVPTAALNVESASRGVLLPRLTTAQRQAIANPAPGLLVFQTDGTPGLYYYQNGLWLHVATRRIPNAAGYVGPVPATGVVSTLAGTGTAGAADGPPATAQFNAPYAVAADGSGNVYVADYANHRIRQVVVATGVVSTLAGAGTAGFANGTGPAAKFTNPSGLALDGSGNLYVADQGNACIRKVVLATGAVSTLAGSPQFAGFVNGPGTAAQFNNPTGVVVAAGSVYVADMSNHCIRKVVAATGAVSTLAGAGTAGYVDGAAATARFRLPSGVAVDGSGNLYVADQGDHRIRKVVVATGAVSTLAGSGIVGFADGSPLAAQFSAPTGVAVDGNGNVLVADQGNHRIRQVVVATGAVSTLAGAGSVGFADGPVGTAQFSSPSGVAVDGTGTAYVADQGNQRVRAIK